MSLKLKRYRSSVGDDSVVFKRHRSSVEESLPHDVIELILERLPVKSLRRFKSVSKNWKSTIESLRFAQRQFCRSKQSDVLVVSDNDGVVHQNRTIVLGSSVIRTVRFPASVAMVCRDSCDGLVCFYCGDSYGIVINPATGWRRRFPISTIERVMADRYDNKDFDFFRPELGFGKDKCKGTFKAVWLYNSSDFGLDNVTWCEVFDFSTNAWRYLLPASPYQILPCQRPVYFHGSLYWFADLEEPKVIYLDLHTETFQTHSKAPFAHLGDPHSVTMYTLSNRLCVSQINWPTQVIWLFDSSSRTWKNMCTMDLTKTASWFGEPNCPLLPVAIMEGNKLLLHGREYLQPLVVHHLQTKSYDLVLQPTNYVHCLNYVESLFSA